MLDVAIGGLAAQPAVASVIAGATRARAGARQRRAPALGSRRAEDLAELDEVAGLE